MRLTAFFKYYTICILLHRCNLKILVKDRFEKSPLVGENTISFAAFLLCNPGNWRDAAAGSSARRDEASSQQLKPEPAQARGAQAKRAAPAQAKVTPRNRMNNNEQ